MVPVGPVEEKLDYLLAGPRAESREAAVFDESYA